MMNTKDEKSINRKMDDNKMAMNHENHEGSNGHDSHHDHHAMMVADFKKRFFISLILMVPILALSPMIQSFMGVDWHFTGDAYILFALSTMIFLYGGKPFLTGLSMNSRKNHLR